MHSWNVAVCKHDDEADFYLLNKNRTPIKFTTRVPFNMGEFLSILEDIKFPLKYTTGVELIRFRRMKNFYGMYSDNIVEIGAKPKRTMRMYVETFVHEIAHHIDSEDDFSSDLGEERRKKAHSLVHYEAQRNNSEYFARGFERFYSQDPQDKKRLKIRNPKLYRTIARLHKKYSAK